MANRRKELNTQGADLWYLIGLITSDGCLSKDGRHVDITSKDYQYLSAIQTKFELPNKIGCKYNGKGKEAFHIQISNRNFYEFLLSIGLTQNKSLTLGPLNIPAQFFNDFLRGLIDGDGCIRKWTHASNGTEQWSLRIYSGSMDFVAWLKNEMVALLKVKGKIYREADHQWILKYGKLAAQVILKKCYYGGCFGLERKILLADNCRSSKKGWNTCRTVNF